MAKPWGGVGAWALDAERAEEEERENAAAFPAPEPPAPAGGAAAFPSLREAAAGGGGKSKKKNKGTTLSLSEFTTYGAAAAHRRAAPVEPRGLTREEMMMLPTGPRERSAEELDRSRGFRSYGGGGGFDGPGGGERRGGFDDEGRRGRSSDLDMPSRADEADNWGAGKTFTPAATDSGRRDRFGGPSPLGRADDIDDWSRDKKPLPSRYPSLGSGGGGGGFRSSPAFRDSPAASDSDRWVRGATPMPHNGEGAGERPRIVLNPPKRDPSATATPPAEVARNRPSPFGAARPREDVLTEKGVDWRKLESDIEQKTSRPTSSHSSRPNSAHSSRPGSPGSQVSAVGSEGAPRARPKVNPFGDAKPREVVLQEKGKDWRKIDLELEHRAVNRPESDEERNLKEEINLMKVNLKEIEGKTSDDSDQASVDAKNLSEKISQLESQLEQLTMELDDKVRFGQRPRSGAGRATAVPATSLTEEPQATVVDRPRSRGGMEPHPRQEERGWGFQGSRSSDRFVQFASLTLAFFFQ
ncbi:Eukaryotic translation initiation factor 4B1 [Dichanthelium oligosanthes]|uniref:Eukaryotic translation initiation factor 4B1 n=1 Tax=Dichanthelium oligosanthes TaxID=888268 RepID=A0A1E5UK40_9POAL|nr:Eukaryotic translation initiation factor 4B1 [Dichanthelium oligosanthes]